MNYLIYGSSYNLINDEIDKILNGRKAIKYSLEDKDIKDILNDVGYGSMFDEEKILVIKNFEALVALKGDAQTLASLSAYLDTPQKNVVIIFTSAEKPNAKGSLKQVIAKLQVIETPIVTKSYELSKLLAEEIRKRGYQAYPRVIDAFATKCASNLDIALSELDKLIFTKKDGKTITERDIENYVSNYNVNDSFGFKDAVINMNMSVALEMLDEFETSKMEIIPLVVMLAKEYQALYNIKILADQKLINDAIGSEMGGMHPYRVKLLREAGRKYTLERLEHIIRYLCDMDLRLVSEDNLGYDEMRRFLLEL